MAAAYRAGSTTRSALPGATHLQRQAPGARWRQHTWRDPRGSLFWRGHKPTRIRSWSYVAAAHRPGFAELAVLAGAPNQQGEVPGVRWRQHTGRASPSSPFYSGPQASKDKFLELGGGSTQGVVLATNLQRQVPRVRWRQHTGAVSATLTVLAGVGVAQCHPSLGFALAAVTLAMPPLSGLCPGRRHTDIARMLLRCVAGGRGRRCAVARSGPSCTDWRLDWETSRKRRLH